MLIDHYLEFFAGEDIASDGDAPVGDVLDTNADRGIGDVTNLALVIQCEGASGATATLEHSDEEGSGFTDALTVPLNDGGVTAARLPVGLKRFLRLTMSTSESGSVDGASAQIVFDFDWNKAYPSPTQNFVQ